MGKSTLKAENCSPCDLDGAIAILQLITVQRMFLPLYRNCNCLLKPLKDGLSVHFGLADHLRRDTSSFSAFIYSWFGASIWRFCRFNVLTLNANFVPHSQLEFARELRRSRSRGKSEQRQIWSKRSKETMYTPFTVLLQKVIGLEPVERKNRVLWLIPKLRLSGGIFSPISSCWMCGGIVAIPWATGI